jgi:heme exporter protein C
MFVQRTDGDRRLLWLGAVAWTAVAISLLLIFLVARTAQEAMGGNLQRIFYFHVPAAWVAYLAFAIVFLSSIAYLRTGDRRWDILGHSSAEIGVVFLTLVLITGPIWAHPVWGTWWQWDARLTSTLVTWLTYVGYLFIRNLTTDRSRAGRLAAVLGIVGLVNIPIVHFSVYWWRTLHPAGPTPANPTANSGLGAPELAAFFVSLGAFTLLFAWLLAMRTRLGRLEERLDDLEVKTAGARWQEPVAGAREVAVT